MSSYEDFSSTQLIKSFNRRGKDSRNIDAINFFNQLTICTVCKNIFEDVNKLIIINK